MSQIKRFFFLFFDYNFKWQAYKVSSNKWFESPLNVTFWFWYAKKKIESINNNWILLSNQKNVAPLKQMNSDTQNTGLRILHKGSKLWGKMINTQTKGWASVKIYTKQKKIPSVFGKNKL